MALQMLPLLQLLVVLSSSPSLGLPVYGTKRYGRSSGYRHGGGGGGGGSGSGSPSWMPLQQPLQRAQRYPLNYYEFYPYSQAYPDDYYYAQDSYPLYYPRASKYEVYQAVLPYYYEDGAYSDPGYGYYGYDRERSADLQEEMLQDAERKEREESQPIGHEMLYETDDTAEADENIDNVKAAFLQNLIMSQMYKDALDKYYDQQYPYSDYYSYDPYGSYGAWKGKDEEELPEYDEEDEEVKELKDLTKPHHGDGDDQDNNFYRSNLDNSYQSQSRDGYEAERHSGHDGDEKDNHWFQKSSFRNQKNENAKKYDQYLSRSSKRSGKGAAGAAARAGQEGGKGAERRPVIRLPPTTTTAVPAEATTLPAAITRRRNGQKEEVMMRPATNVRRPLAGPVLEMITKEDFDRKRTPSVYDQIKYMLDMEKSMENKYGGQQIRPNTMKKRLFTSDEALAEQLTLLKKKQ